MVTNTMSSGVAGASVPAPSTGEALRFAAYVADLIGDDRIEDIAWHIDLGTQAKKLYVTVTDTTHGETIAHLLGLDPRSDLGRNDNTGFSCWTGTSGDVPVFLSAPLALGGLPRRRPYRWSEDTTADVKAVA
ncbi:hypothetical protein C8K30_1038 [Promicromonospora sp. AC04]|uniref:hypothetical protein n=1 Tax=Promicromonospora sp. AC04 TaxID=2135723 RepID=UPI000D3B3243|nr:hypothetical protein [Promicromonospora sp. AC04]PUB28592.1 hypothetical protein C8K30_1038 [Promicromonospora sp. AC04]